MTLYLVKYLLFLLLLFYTPHNTSVFSLSLTALLSAIISHIRRTTCRPLFLIFVAKNSKMVPLFYFFKISKILRHITFVSFYPFFSLGCCSITLFHLFLLKGVPRAIFTHNIFCPLFPFLPILPFYLFENCTRHLSSIPSTHVLGNTSRCQRSSKYST